MYALRGRAGTDHREPPDQGKGVKGPNDGVKAPLVVKGLKCR